MWKKIVSFRKELSAVLNLITWNKILQILVILLICGVVYVLYELHTEISKVAINQLTHASQINTTSISNATITRLDKIVFNSNIIIGINVSSVDFNRNTKRILYTSISNLALKEIYKFYTKNSAQTELPLFVKDSTSGNNLLIGTMNGEIVCDTWSYAFNLMPETKDYVKSVCATGIPSYYGKYYGLLSVYLNKIPTPSETESLKRIIWDLSEEIYNRDFK